MKIRHGMGIGDDEAGGATYDGECRQPMTSFRQLTRKQPNIFLIVKKVFGERPPGDLSRRR